MSRSTFLVQDQVAPLANQTRVYYDVVAKGEQDGQLTVNTYLIGANVDSALGDPVDATPDILEDFEDQFLDLIAVGQSENWQMTSLTVKTNQLLEPVQQYYESVRDYGDYNGDVAGDALPSLVAILMPFRYISPSGRVRYAPRYIPGVPESGTLGSHTTGATAGAIGTACAAMQDGLQPSEGIISYTSAFLYVLARVVVGGQPLGWSARQVIAMVSETLLSTCRRRKVGRGQ